MPTSDREAYAAMKESRATAMPSQGTPRYGRFSRRTVILAGVAAALIIIGLAVGLGVGLGIGNNNDNGETESSPTPTSIPPPSGNSTSWQPAVNSTWQIVLKEPIKMSTDNQTTDPDVEIFDIDLFTNSNETISLLHDLGKKVICYFSGGSYEPYRPDSAQFQQSVLGKPLDGWDDEKWIDIRSDSVRNIMAERIKLAKEKGCDAVDPDNVDGYVSIPYDCRYRNALTKPPEQRQRPRPHCGGHDRLHGIPCQRDKLIQHLDRPEERWRSADKPHIRRAVLRQRAMRPIQGVRDFRPDDSGRQTCIPYRVPERRAW